MSPSELNDAGGPSAKELTVASLFSGCGGLDLGFIENGFQLEFAADNDPAAVAAYSANLRHNAELLDVKDDQFIDSLRNVGQCDVLLGGFPCQGFSKAGPKNQGDDRNVLYRAMISALKELSPRLFIAENVDGLAQNYSGELLKQIVKDCADVGYRVDWRILDAAWFGVPQHRRRIVIVGIRNDETCSFQWPQATHTWVARKGERAIHDEYPNWASSTTKPASMRDGLASLSLDSPDHITTVPVSVKDKAILAKVTEGRKLCNARNDATSVRTWEIPEAFGEVTNRERDLLEALARNRRHKRYGRIPNGNPLPIHVLREVFAADLEVAELQSLVERRFLKRTESGWDLRGAMFASGLFKRPFFDEPSPTVLTVFGNPRYFAHPIEPRPFTVREVARLQTFPDTFLFGEYGISPVDAYRLIGNAVPPRLGEELARAVLNTFSMSSAKWSAGWEVSPANVVAAEPVGV